MAISKIIYFWLSMLKNTGLDRYYIRKHLVGRLYQWTIMALKREVKASLRLDLRDTPNRIFYIPKICSFLTK